MKTTGNNIKTNVMKRVRDLPALCGTAAIIGCLFACATAQALDITSLDTGAGHFGNVAVADNNWTVSLLSGTAPVGVGPSAYVVPSNTGGAIGTYWFGPIPNSSVSSWITYNSSIPQAADTGNELFQYQLAFTADGNGVIGINFASDNASKLYVNDPTRSTLLASNPGTVPFHFLSSPYDLTVTAGTTYTVDITVANPSNGGDPDPSGLNVRFTGQLIPSVPDGGVTVILLGGALSALGLIRRKLA